MTSPINLYGWEQFLHLGAIWKKWPWTLNDHFKVCIRSSTRQPSVFKANRRLHLFILCSLVFAPVIVPKLYRQKVSLYQLIVWTSWFYTTYHSAWLLWTVRRLMLFWKDFTLVFIAGFFFIKIYLGCLSCSSAHLPTFVQTGILLQRFINFFPDSLSSQHLVRIYTHIYAHEIFKQTAKKTVGILKLWDLSVCVCVCVAALKKT